MIGDGLPCFDICVGFEALVVVVSSGTTSQIANLAGSASLAYLSLEGVVQARLVAADARVDLVRPALGGLPHPERVRQERPGE